ncbi:hypothetical protein ACFL5G_02200 [Candidatus Margulisiibacteriota bacterium]
MIYSNDITHDMNYLTLGYQKLNFEGQKRELSKEAKRTEGKLGELISVASSLKEPFDKRSAFWSIVDPLIKKHIVNYSDSISKKSGIHKVLKDLKVVLERAGKNPAVRSLSDIARQEIISNEERLHITKGYGRSLADEYFPTKNDPALNFYVYGINPQSIQTVDPERV